MNDKSLGYFIIAGLFVLFLFGSTIGWMITDRWIKNADKEDDRKYRSTN